MSDLFHQRVPSAFIRQVFGVMKDAQQHIFQVLTKRPGRLAKLAPSLPWPGKRLDGSERRVAAICRARRPSTGSASRYPVRERGASPRSPHGPFAGWHPLGHRRRRVRPERPSHAARVGARAPRSLLSGWGFVFPQAARRACLEARRRRRPPRRPTLATVSFRGRFPHYVTSWRRGSRSGITEEHPVVPRSPYSRKARRSEGLPGRLVPHHGHLEWPHSLRRRLCRAGRVRGWGTWFAHDRTSCLQGSPGSLQDHCGGRLPLHRG